MKRVTLALMMIALLFAGLGCVKSKSSDVKQNQTETIDRKAIIIEAKKNGLILDDGEVEHMKDPTVIEIDQNKIANVDVKKLLELNTKTWHAAALADVTSGSAYGLAHAQFVNKKFTLVANVGGLPEPNQGYFYEAWLVKRSDGIKIISLGEMQKQNEKFIVGYESTRDLSSYDFFVLTLEPKDSNSSPAEHLLEGAIN